MSERETAGPVQAPVGTASATPGDRRPEQVAVLLLDTATGRLVAGSPAARRRLGGTAGHRLAGWLCDLATAVGHRDDAAVRTWSGGGIGRLRAVSLPVDFRSRRCLLVVLRDEAGAPVPRPEGAATGAPAVDHRCAAFTLDPLGRVDSWGPTPQRLLGHRPEQVIGADTTPLLTPPARLTGDHHLALTHAYRTGEDRSEGWRLCADGRVIWAEVTVAPLYDATDRMIGFAQVVHDLTPVRRLQQRRVYGHGAATTVDLRDLPGQRCAAPAQAQAQPPASRPAARPVPGTAPGGGRRPAGRVPAPRRPPAAPGRP